jgi:hypothetical protein
MALSQTHAHRLRLILDTHDECVVEINESEDKPMCPIWRRDTTIKGDLDSDIINHHGACRLLGIDIS